jgi:hypothetical protein
MEKLEKKQIPEKKENVKLVKISELSKEELEKIKMDDLWVIKPDEDYPETKARLCGCRNVCLA